MDSSVKEFNYQLRPNILYEVKGIISVLQPLVPYEYNYIK